MSRSHSLVLADGGGVEVFCGIDVARETHHAVALDLAGRDRRPPNVPLPFYLLPPVKTARNADSSR